MKTVAIYHKNCIDGTTAAAVVLRKFPGASLFPLGFSYEKEEIEAVLKDIEPGDTVYTVDCAIGAGEIIAAGHPLTVIDHHQGNETDIRKLSSDNKLLTYVFDNNKSGASLSWSYFFPEETMPELIRYVEDVDLWKWKFGDDSRNVNNYLSTLINKPGEILKLFGVPLETIKKEGSVISRYTGFMIDQATSNCDPVMLVIKGHTVPFYNIPTFKSECGNILSTSRNEAVALFGIDGNEVKISFRSLDRHTPSALDLAKLVNGGGHRNAAGASMKLDEFIAAIKK